MRDAFDYTKKLRGLAAARPTHRIWLANPKLSKTIVPTGAYYRTSNRPLTKAEIEIATNVINGRWLAAYSN